MSRLPEATDSADQLPTTTLPTKLTWHRIGAAAHPSPVFWSSSPGGRFNPASGSFGTCYMCDTLQGAMAESICRNVGDSANNRFSKEADLAALAYYEIDIATSLKLLDLTVENLARHSLDARIYTEYDINAPGPSPYRWGPSWADHAKTECGLDGILYPSRHHTGCLCLALFTKDNSNINYRELGRCTDDRILEMLEEDFDWALLN